MENSSTRYQSRLKSELKPEISTLLEIAFYLGPTDSWNEAEALLDNARQGLPRRLMIASPGDLVAFFRVSLDKIIQSDRLIIALESLLYTVKRKRMSAATTPCENFGIITVTALSAAALFRAGTEIRTRLAAETVPQHVQSTA